MKKFKLFRRKEKEVTFLARHLGADKIVFGIVSVVMLFHCFTLLYPLAWMINASLKNAPEMEFFLTSSIAFPEKLMFSNYIDAFTALNNSQSGITLWVMIFNSVWYTGLTTIASIFAPLTVGYVLAKYNFRGKEFIYSLIIFSITVPIVGTGASGMRAVSQLGLWDNPLKLVVNCLNGFTGSFLVYYGFFRSMSWAYAEAAQIDGAGPYTIYFRIMLPQAVSIILTYAILNGIAAWNEYETILLYFPSYPTLAAGLFEFQSDGARGDTMSIYYAGLIISMIPSVTILAIFSNKILTSISVGGLK